MAHGDPADRRWDPWAIMALLAGFLVPPVAIAPAIVAFVSLRQHPGRRGLAFAWFGVLSFVAFAAFMGYLMVTRH